MDNSIVIDQSLIEKYDLSGPRYTSYPTAVQFHDGFDEAAYRQLALGSNDAGRPLSLYFHIPFCDTVCFYCACNKVITRNRARAGDYLRVLHREIELQGQLFDRSRPVDQLHWGGGTPTFISDQQMRSLMEFTRKHFTLLDEDRGEYSIEVDPRTADTATIGLLRELGFNRLSVGVQDFDPRVQAAVNRIQPREVTLRALQAARDCGFRSVSIDLIYGLPLQTVDSFSRTLEEIIALSPDRLSVFNYAHLPHMFKTQKQIVENDLPAAAVKLDILRNVIGLLTDAGYVYIGMDHFARPDDELALAQREGTLYRNFQGYSTHADCDLVAMGATAIGMVGSSYSQNQRAIADYSAALDGGRLPVFRGVRLGEDDLIRRQVITELICHWRLSRTALEARFGIRFETYFATELARLRAMEDDGLLRISPDALEVLPAGRLLIRNVCMVFDAYLHADAPGRFSRVI